jgi:hypothetical protein
MDLPFGLGVEPLPFSQGFYWGFVACVLEFSLFLFFFFFFSNLCLGYLLDSVVLFQDVEFRCVPVYCFTKASFTKLDFCGVP